MINILNIDTAVEGASISLAADGVEIAGRQTRDTLDSASWLHTAIRDLLKENDLPIKSLHAVAITSGPGSYTGLRVGMASAKGLCYALSIPLITVNTLELMAAAALPLTNARLCPMIDARRMEVFTAVYEQDLSPVLQTTNMVLDEASFSDILDAGKLAFFGNGSEKFKPFCHHKNAVFLELFPSASDLVPISFRLYNSRAFTELAYSEPLYGKEFYSPTPRPLV